MQYQTRYTRLSLMALGVWTVLLSFIVMLRVTELRVGQDDALSDVSIVVLLLSLLLALGGGCLVVRGMRYNGHPT